MKFWKSLYHKIDDFECLVMLIVVKSRGSSPGRQGFKMIIGPDNNLIGSIGGGMLEYKLVEESKVLLTAPATLPVPELLKFRHAPDSENASGLICTGDQWLVRFIVRGKDMETLKKIGEASVNSNACIMELDSRGIRLKKAEESPNRYIFSQENEATWNYRELVGFRDCIHIIGAGHVGAALAELMHFLDFRVIVYDDRKIILNKMDPKIETHLVDNSYDAIKNEIDDSVYNYVSILSHSHELDKQALSLLLHKKLAYLGLMGSKQKINIIFQELKANGTTEEALSKVFAPIGLDIKSESPEEIAVSIAAQIISLKNKNN